MSITTKFNLPPSYWGGARNLRGRYLKTWRNETAIYLHGYMPPEIGRIYIFFFFKQRGWTDPLTWIQLSGEFEVHWFSILTWRNGSSLFVSACRSQSLISLCFARSPLNCIFSILLRCLSFTPSVPHVWPVHSLLFSFSHTHISDSDTPAWLLCSHCNYISFAAVPPESLS